MKYFGWRHVTTVIFKCDAFWPQASWKDNKYSVFKNMIEHEADNGHGLLARPPGNYNALFLHFLNLKKLHIVAINGCAFDCDNFLIFKRGSF